MLTVAPIGATVIKINLFRRYCGMAKAKAVKTVVDYIVSGGLYNFKSLEERTQQRLINAYGEDFETLVNAELKL